MTAYGAEGRYDWHIDVGPESLSIRKLSFVVQLTAPEDYDGGDLELMAGLPAQFGVRDQGTMVCFPSYVLHRVRPVERGLRRTLVGWVSGPPYR
jgi:PKHD-type hydroxylase